MSPREQTDQDTVEVDREVFEDTVSILKDIETVLSGSAAYSKADTVERYRKNLEAEE